MISSGILAGTRKALSASPRRWAITGEKLASWTQNPLHNSSFSIQECKEARENSKEYNSFVWSKVLNLSKVDAKLRNAGFSFTMKHLLTGWLFLSFIPRVPNSMNKSETPTPGKLTWRIKSSHVGRFPFAGRKKDGTGPWRVASATLLQWSVRGERSYSSRNFESGLRFSRRKSSEARLLDRVEARIVA